MFVSVRNVLCLDDRILSCIWECNDDPVFGSVSFVMCLAVYALSCVWVYKDCPVFVGGVEIVLCLGV